MMVVTMTVRPTGRERLNAIGIIKPLVRTHSRYNYIILCAEIDGISRRPFLFRSPPVTSEIDPNTLYKRAMKNAIGPFSQPQNPILSTDGEPAFDSGTDLKL